jgi:hypothetical protein
MAAPNEPTWWAESADLPGFTAVYPSLGELQRQAEDAVHFALETNDVEVEWGAPMTHRPGRLGTLSSANQSS